LAPPNSCSPAHPQAHPAEQLPAVAESELVTPVAQRQVGRLPGVSLVVAEHFDAGGDAAGEGAAVGVLSVQDDQAVARDEAGELAKGVSNRGQAFIAVEVVLVDVEDHGGPRPQVEEGTIVFAGFGDEVRAVADAAAAAELLGFGPHNEAGVQTRLPEYERQPSGGGALAVRAADSDAMLASHQSPQQLRVFNDRDRAASGFREFRMVLRDGSRDDQQFGLGWDGVCGLSRRHADTAVRQA